jgi:hypothetical protein
LVKFRNNALRESFGASLLQVFYLQPYCPEWSKIIS